jgi:hypothetical protein
MDFNLIETFNDTCGINFAPGDITTKECNQYSNESYQKLRNDYLEAIFTKFLNSDESNKECLINLLSENIKISNSELDTMESNSTDFEDKINQSFDLDSNIDLDKLENNLLLSEQRLKETDELLYINNIKYYAIIVSLIIILIIEVILIKL